MSKSISSQILALLALAALAAIWGYNWVVMKVAVEDAAPFDFAALRSFYGALALFLVMIALRKPLRPPAIRGTLLYGVLHSGGAIGLMTWALVNGGAGKTSVLTYTMSFWSLLFAGIFLKERLQKGQWVSVGLAFGGLFFILLPFDLSSDLFSKGLAILGGICWALSSIVAKRMHQHAPPDLLSFTAWQMLFGSVPLLVISRLVSAPPIHWTPTFMGALLYNVIPGGAIAWLLWLYALTHLSTGTAGLGSLFTPVVGILAASFQLGEVPSLSESIGMGFILMALVFLSIQAIQARDMGKQPLG